MGLPYDKLRSTAACKMCVRCHAREAAGIIPQVTLLPPVENKRKKDRHVLRDNKKIIIKNPKKNPFCLLSQHA